MAFSRVARVALLGLILVPLGSGVALAAESVGGSSSGEAEAISFAPQVALDTFWVLMAAFLVFFMQAGFGMVEAGLIRAKNTANILMKNMMDFSMASLGYFCFGYALMYGGDGWLMGTEGWFLIGLPDTTDSGLPLYAYWLFQAVFVGAAATIVAGGVAERMKFSAYLLYSLVISAIVYPIVGHWVWGGGWLTNGGFEQFWGATFYDFAGSTVVHAVGGFTALVGTMMIGPRIGKFDNEGKPQVIAGHNVPLVALGVFILWLGWFGFNAGSTTSFSQPGVVAHIALTTNLAAAAGAVAAMFTAWVKFGKPGLTLTLNGALAGLVGITAGCNAVEPGNAIVIGAVAGIISTFGVVLLDRWKIDDPVGAIPVHGFAGIWGTLAVGLFASSSVNPDVQNGLLLGGDGTLLWVQALGCFSIIATVMVLMGIVFKAIDTLIGLRVSVQTELLGLDVGEHGEESYNGFQIFLTE